MQKTLLIGNLGIDPELRHTEDGTPVCSFSVATTERWKDAEGHKQERTEWHRIVAWRGWAETCAEYLKKGAKVYIEGKNQTRKWDDEEGITRYTTEIVLKYMEMLGGKGGSGTEEPPQGDNVPF